MNRTKYLIKNAGILAISNFASKILVFFLVPLYTNVLSKVEYGTYDLIISTITLLLPILTCNIADAVMRFSMDEKYPKEEIAKIGLRFTIISIVISWILVYFIKICGFWAPLSGLELYTAAYFSFFALNQFFIQLAKGQEKVFEMGVAGVSSTLIMVTANLFFLLVVKLGLPGFFIANILAQGVPSIYLFIKLRVFSYINGIFRISDVIRKEMLVYCTPLIATTLGWWANSTSDRYVVAFLCGVGANGLLSVSYKIPSIINTVQGIFIQAWQISAIKEYDSKDKAVFYGKAFKLLNVLMVFTCSGLIICTKPLGHIMYLKDFYSAWQYVPFLLISCVFNSASGFLGPILSANKDSKAMAMSAIYGAIVNIIFNVLLVYIIGIQGACIATVIASFVIYIFRKKAVVNDILFIDYKNNLISWGILCAQAALEIYTRYWYLEILLIILLIILNHKGIKDLLKMAKSIIKR